MVAVNLLFTLFCWFATIECYTIDLSQKDRLFNGIGALSAGASSRLLIDYEEPYRSHILDYLFLPNFGASLNILKVEIGGDTWSGCGTESSHMHSSTDLNYNQGYEYWLMTEAKKRNPKIKLYGLPWGFPAWIGSGALNINMANYTIQWLNGAKNVYNCNIDYLGIWNEDNWDTSYVKLLRQMLNENGYKDVKIVVADGALVGVSKILSSMANDKQFASSFDIIGVHYPPGSSDNVTADGISMSESGKILWSSEDSSTNDDAIGGGCWARILNWNYIYGNYTSTIMWSLISSWYEYMPWYGDALMNAAWPWNAHYEVMSPIWITAHTTQFVHVFESDWYYLKVGYGSGELIGGGTYVSFISSDSNNNLNLTIVIETMDYQNSLCIRNNPSNFGNASIQDIIFQLKNDINNGYILPKQLYVWKSVLFGDNIIWFEQQESVVIDENNYSFQLKNVEPNSVFTLSTISTAHKGSYPDPPSKEKFPLPYSDDFESYENDRLAKYFSDQAGSFVIQDGIYGRKGKVLEQIVPYPPSENNTGWGNGGDSPQPITIIGDYNLSDVTVFVSVLMISNNHNAAIYNVPHEYWNTSNIMIGVRWGGNLTESGCKGNPREYPCVEAYGAEMFKYGYFMTFDHNGYWKLFPGEGTPVLIDGHLENVTELSGVWFNASFSIKGYSMSATFNGVSVFDNVIDEEKRFLSGQVALACGWQTCQFDDFEMR